jgi:hypothetical protein
MSNPSATQSATALESLSASGQTVLTFSNRFWSLEIDLQPSINPRRLVHLGSGKVVADEDYCYQLALGSAEGGSGYVGPAQSARAVRFMEWHVAEDPVTHRTSLTVSGRVDFGPDGPTDIVLAHTITLFYDADQIDEEIELVHRFGRDTHLVSDFRFGFRKRIFDSQSASWVDGLDANELVPIPFRRRRGQTRDYLTDNYSAADLVPANWEGNNLPNRQSEAWSWHGRGIGFVFAKYSQAHIEFALVDGEFYTRVGEDVPDGHVSLADVGNVCLRFGGAGRTHGAPGEQIRLTETRSSYRFGISTIIPFKGGWEDGHRAYAALMRKRGHVTPKGFNPPVHWNELYELSWRGGTNAPLQELPELWAQAEVAHAFGAEAFYFDPVWDLFEGSSIWDTERLGPLTDFVARLKRDYQLELSLHLMMHTKSTAEDPRIYRRDKQGDIIRWQGLYEGGYICPATDAWKDQKTARLLELAKAGVTFFMFDFCDYGLAGTNSGISLHSAEACWCPDHGHAVPMSLEEHSSGVVEVMRRVKALYPDLLIEAHDRIAGGIQDYLPLYYEHAMPGGATFDEHWGFEYMWNPYMDLLSGKALSLYEYNLAFDIPLYLHINLGFDNVGALAFWWYASTCRHLGLGGIKPGHKNWEGHVLAMRTYLRLKPFFAEGRFVGLSRTLHGHVLDDRKLAVLVAFNLASDTIELRQEIDLGLLGLPETARLEGPGITSEAGGWVLRASMEGLSTRVIEVSWHND